MATTFDQPRPHDSKGPFTLKLRIPPAPRYARTVRAAMRGFAGLHRVNDADLETLTCAVGEALANAIEHGGEGDEVEVQCRIDGQTITVTVTDWGRGFDEVPSGPVPMPHDAAENGRGIPIMQRCTHFFRVDSTPGEGTVVTLVRYRDGGQPAGGDGLAS